ncbi:MAG: hypothetical protein A2504_10400 [Bdellovibrionales bacterium RIFOXYD12_FULL_39_22]|nr:MAG: hypothetical protein A2385_17015 [Bdellovibrionales bacterium RIFOXYB1_FULL_39_21]OFZ44110.1 MAG: hypothetical protein A2485_14225 [Bdellovibrionales bacterium RIFOXYC12_FULL_39_17]OFZ48656.1 MAG: hypothetical protein A2404_08220 [Bdellovibrionales bacterium RIFOXYC1_FULL_39_130]OFZ76770.1 MAG: hypothetical protein A2560_10510 [Bdellovibrionales bacterium RIFOXYD1_FULL_39_84]OFZ95073.1 MAG: hypothetical protein A2504_10400 [Bdellovibrionales bacterium RIFOXYD12_FULL_39_22]HLE11012.1 hi
MQLDWGKLKKRIGRRLFPIIIQDDLPIKTEIVRLLQERLIFSDQIIEERGLKELTKIKRGIIFQSSTGCVVIKMKRGRECLEIPVTCNSEAELRSSILKIATVEKKLLDLEISKYLLKDLLLTFNFFQKKREIESAIVNYENGKIDNDREEYNQFIDEITELLAGILPLSENSVERISQNLLTSRSIGPIEEIAFLDIHLAVDFFDKNVNNFENYSLIPYKQTNQTLYLLIRFNNKFLKNRNFIIYLVSLVVHNLFALDEYLQSGRDGFIDAEVEFNLITMPFALISAGGELLLHNSLFLRLNLLPNRCLATEDNASIEVSGDLYTIIKRPVETSEAEVAYRFLFIKSDFFEKKMIGQVSAKEMGVITSSLAHELNNPIAGILATIEMLLLEGFWKESEIAQLKEMKNSAYRCKQLINVFLGFSRVQANFPQENILEEAFREALSLLRFRMIESNIILDIKFEEGSKFSYNLNISLVSMIVYMILSEVVTSISQYDLIAPNVSQGSRNRRVEGVLLQSEYDAKLMFENKLGPAPKILESKLLCYLLETANLKVDFRDNIIVFAGRNASLF